jgi:short-subunit dehydrogenase
MSKSRCIVVTGASSGIGRAIAQAAAEPGVILGLLGRDRDRLAQAASACRSAGAVVEIGIVDVRDAGAMCHWLESFDREHPIDLLIANAGVTGGLAPNRGIETAATSREVLETNILGVINTVQPLLRPMTERRTGQIAIVSSIAGFVPVTDAPSYCASKAAVLRYGLALRSGLRVHGVKVNVICPGYVATPMADREIGPRPFEMSPQKAARLTLEGLGRDKAVIAFPRFLALISWIGGVIPDRVRQFTERWFRFDVTEAK